MCRCGRFAKTGGTPLREVHHASSSSVPPQLAVRSFAVAVWRHANAERLAPQLVLACEASLDIDPSGFLVSEKCDGVRAHWDGRHLRFRSGRFVTAPPWFLARLPPTPLDGELWLERGRFEALAGIVRRARPNDDEWRQLRYLVFEQPDGAGSFAERAMRLREIVDRVAWPQMRAVEQSAPGTPQALRRRLDEVLRAGGEGLMLHRADALYRTGRNGDLLKLKPRHDAETLVVGHVAGQGRNLGRMGALHVRTGDGIEFFIGTGFSDAQRDEPAQHGAVVSFSHRGFTHAGVPRFASFLHVREL